MNDSMDFEQKLHLSSPDYYNIPLQEIVNNLKLVPNCCVVYDKDNKQIVLFYENNGISEKEIRKALAVSFPRYMIPTQYHEMEELPRNTNGKIDRLKLSHPILPLK